MAKQSKKAEVIEKYVTKEISYDKGSTIIENKGWDWICENNHGTCYWNKITGELMWLSDEENIARYSKLI
jgi:hypothetical protein